MSSSANRPYSVSCESCTWRYSLNISRRILTTNPRRLFAITFTPTLTSQADFRSWRIQVRNVLDYRRRESRWWRDVGLWGWLNADGHIKGIASLGAILEDEFLHAFGRRWPTTLRAIDEKELRNEVYFSVRPSMIFNAGPHHGRYQHLKLAIEPAGKVRLTRALTEERCALNAEHDAMPVVL
ncbi:hypothetical protein JKG68_23055 [Microvirga aerilata]|uniref:Uncharacterized protein n=1 Tax=Microvirga aerilata TaxID=670292 RepID=A0A936ZGM9_9HYPH|nr:hypothetical protein [Microvirga aerilata]MBL0406827.1 hypothetical protein [Microvirga aerilata]